MLNRLYWLVLLTAASTAAMAEETKSDANPILEIWQTLDTIMTPLPEACPEEHSWLPDLGMRGLYCQVKSRLDYAGLIQLAGIPAFLSGPHDGARLTLDAPHQFGHYNPEFIAWLRANLLPAQSDPALLATTQPWYDQFLRQRARTWYLAHQRLAADPVFFQAELAAYQAFLQAQSTPEFDHEYYAFAGLAKEGYSEYEVDTAVRYWLRRDLDGTRDDFFAGLTDLMQLYDADFIAAQSASAQANSPKANAIRCVESVMKATREVFPEAYTQFMQAGYEWQDVGEIWPTEVSFYVPARFFPTPLDDQQLRARLAQVVEKVTRENDAHCEQIDVGDVETKSWIAWPDKKVRKVTIRFGIGC